jgi:hypothetical protein
MMAARLVGSFPGKIGFSILSNYKSDILLALERSLNDHKQLAQMDLIKVLIGLRLRFSDQVYVGVYGAFGTGSHVWSFLD